MVAHAHVSLLRLVAFQIVDGVPYHRSDGIRMKYMDFIHGGLVCANPTPRGYAPLTLQIARYVNQGFLMEPPDDATDGGNIFDTSRAS